MCRGPAPLFFLTSSRPSRRLSSAGVPPRLPELFIAETKRRDAGPERPSPLVLFLSGSLPLLLPLSSPANSALGGGDKAKQTRDEGGVRCGAVRCGHGANGGARAVILSRLCRFPLENPSFLFFGLSFVIFLFSEGLLFSQFSFFLFFSWVPSFCFSFLFLFSFL